MFFNLERPHHHRDTLAFDRLAIPEMYRQWSHQGMLLEDVTRGALIFDAQSWRSAQKPAVMTAGWEESLLGCSVAEFSAAGFVLYSSSLIGGSFPLPNIVEMNVVYDAFGGRERFEQIVERLYVSDVEQFRTERGRAVDDIRKIDRHWAVSEPFAFNPLVRRPLLRGLKPDGSDAAIAPVPADIMSRASVEGVIYEGLEFHGSDFTGDVGSFFEGYVGRQLETMTGPLVFPQFAYRGRGGSERMTVDWIVVLPNAVILVECKSAMPNRSVVEGRDTFAEGHRQIREARKQILTTAALIKDGQPELSRIPAGRPLIGVVVTLGTYLAANDPEIISDGQTLADIPIGVIDVASLERFVTLSLNDAEAFATKILSASPTERIEPRTIIKDLHWGPNRLLQAAYDNLAVIKAFTASGRTI